LADCLEVKDGPFADYLRAELIKRADHRCAVDLAEFRAHRRAVTLHGQVRSGERHVKDDRHPVDDPRRWVLGWANERKVTALQDELVQVAEQRAVVDEDVARVQDRRDEVQRRGDAFARLDAYRSWSDVDVASAHSRAATADAERARLTAGSDRLQEIAEALQANEDATKEVGDTLERLTGALARWQAERQRKAGERDRDQQEVGSRPETERDAARSAYPALRERLGRAVPTRSEDCGQAADRLSEELHRRVERLGGELNGLALNLTKLMNDIVRRWPEAGVDMDASVEARSDFRTFHERVATDDLPRFEQEFKRQLNTNTIRELAQFSNWLRRQAEEIDVRVGRINDALGAIPYNPGRYIRLEKQPTPNQDVAAFRAELRAATDDTLVGDDDQYSEQRFLDVKRIIDRFRGREGYSDADRAWTRRVTDVRNWFVFSASERDLESDEEWEHYSDSDGKSGGQKEKLAYTILAASLAYQFGLEWGARTSRDFRFAVIDEAFGRGSDVSTRYALELFAKLGLQLLIVTPLQKVHVIEPYVRSIGYVDNPGGTASRLQTMTIEEYHARRDRHRAAPGAPTR
ncbi:ATP-binding protein, partial [Nocardioides massiliensis]